jgi:hypothetical protein
MLPLIPVSCHFFYMVTTGNNCIGGAYFNRRLIVIYLGHPTCKITGKACPRAAIKRGRTEVSVPPQWAALVPSAGTITLQTELHAARVPTASAFGASVRCFQCMSFYAKVKVMQVPSAGKTGL